MSTISTNFNSNITNHFLLPTQDPQKPDSPGKLDPQRPDSQISTKLTQMVANANAPSNLKDIDPQEVKLVSYLFNQYTKYKGTPNDESAERTLYKSLGEALKKKQVNPDNYTSDPQLANEIKTLAQNKNVDERTLFDTALTIVYATRLPLDSNMLNEIASGLANGYPPSEIEEKVGREQLSWVLHSLLIPS